MTWLVGIFPLESVQKNEFLYFIESSKITAEKEDLQRKKSVQLMRKIDKRGKKKAGLNLKY